MCAAPTANGLLAAEFEFHFLGLGHHLFKLRGAPAQAFGEHVKGAEGVDNRGCLGDLPQRRLGLVVLPQRARDYPR
jgi:hypothetical protein